MSTYTLIAQPSTADAPSIDQIKTALESKNEQVKIDTMKLILTIMYNGDLMPQLLMHVIRFVMPSRNKALKKLLYFYWEVCPKLNPDGKLKQEMILVCNAIRNDIQHPNEYIRGATLRFLCKLKEAELLEPLVPTCRQCLEHRQAYVRKNAVFAIYSIYTHSDHLIPDAPELIYNFLLSESDAICKRNAFVAVCLLDHDKAAEWVMQNYTSMVSTDELMQLAVIDFVRKDASVNPANKGQYLKLIFELLDVSANTVVYEAATSLTALTNNPVAIKAAASKFIELIVKGSDNNAKLIMLDRIDKLRKDHDGVLDDFVMEILRVLSSPDIDVRKKALDIGLEMTSVRNVEEIVSLLKKELTKSMEQEYEKNNEYRQLLIHAVHTCAIRFPKVASSVVYLLMDFIAEMNNASAVDVISFIKEVVEKFPQLRQSIIERLLLTLSETKAGRVYRGALWIIGEYCSEEVDIRAAWKQIRASIGEVPILAAEQRLLERQTAGDVTALTDGAKDKQSSGTTSRRILPDGTYASESAIAADSSRSAGLEAVKSSLKPPLRTLILDGDYYLATVLSSTLTKLVMRYAEISSGDHSRTNALRAEAMLIMTSIIRAGQSQFAKQPIDEDSTDRMLSCIKSLTDFELNKDLQTVFLKDTKAAFSVMISTEDKKRAADVALERQKDAVQPDDVVSFRQLSTKATSNGANEFEQDVIKAAGDDLVAEDDLSSKLTKVVQLTGCSDPVYVEAYVKVHQFDIILDVLLVNQTSETLQNLSIEFATLGDLKIVERPTTHNLAPHSFLSVQATIKVSSTDTGVIFGNCVYDGAGGKDSHIVILSDVHIDIMDYIQPARCSESSFRSMWTEFEWENKVNIKDSNHQDIRTYLAELMAKTNMSCLTPEASIEGDCGFLSVNLYAKSVFGEDALANVSLEKQGEGPIIGHVRIRSKTQGIALSIGELVHKSLNSRK